ncbi:MAG: patatin-like phospholipase family protein [Desulfobacteraceae bacterium]|nr:patatin-like phospholipase family protein [Desulfobacteraceae bacterium]
MTNTDHKKPAIKRALVLSGGGGRGAYQIGVIKYLNKIGWTPDMICGTSIGAINAAALGSGISAGKMEELWLSHDRKKTKQFSLLGIAGTIMSGRKYSPLADAGRIRALLEALIDINALRNSDIRIFVTAINMKTGQIRYFTNKVIEMRHLMAAAAIPMVFPWQYINGIPHWDAGLMVNTPISPALSLKAQETVVVLHSPVGAHETQEPKTGKQAFELAAEHMLTGSFNALLPDNSWETTPEADYFETPLYGSQKLEQSLNGIKMHVVAPQGVLGLKSMFTYSAEQAKNLIEEGYKNAESQLGKSLTP